MTKKTNSARDFIAEILQQQSAHVPCQPLADQARQFIHHLLQVLFPQLRSVALQTRADVESELQQLQGSLQTMFSCIGGFDSCSALHLTDADTFFAALPAIHDLLQQDAQAIFAGDPAAESLDEVVLAYPGFYAIAVHRCAHELYRLNVPLLPRLFSEHAHQATGIDIHPGAQIGHSFCIDHGTGIVIGETAVIGDQVKMYQGVTLGALSVAKALANHKRHPTIEDRVVLYAQAVILGGETIVGHDSIIGGNVWLTHSVEPHSQVSHQSQTRVCTLSQRACQTGETCPQDAGKK